jgi:hypothetical protein|tara:strand:- start:491 stop:931 length:441 start_codon:yes stop_codon:yes gene_type:complete
MKLDKKQFKDVLQPIHKHFWEKAYKKLSAKMSVLYSSLKRRSEEYDVAFSIERDEIRKMFYASYGGNCKYCEKRLTYKTIACDHIVPLSKKGETSVKNLQLICKTCNTRKGPLDEEDFNMLIQLVQELPAEIRVYVMKKLAKGGRY